MQSLAIETNSLTRSFGAIHAVDGLSLSVPAGRIYGLVGPDGAGKTTTLRMLCGALRPDGGQAIILGRDVARDPEACGGGSATCRSVSACTAT
jgi:ABC-2 type transport system ATP-binding protein